MGKHEDRPPTGGRDAAGIGPHIREGMRLVPLKELDGYTLADGEPDIRGWEVQTVSGRKIGEVDDLLVETASGEVVLLDVDLDGTRQRTLAPARAVQLLRDRRVVLIDSTELRDAEQLPTLARTGEVTADEMRVFRDNYAQIYGTRGFHAGRDYEIQRREQSLRFGHEDREPVDQRDERVTQPRSGDGAVRFPRGDEEIVVDRRPVVMEEVVVRRRTVEPNEVSATDSIDADRINERDARDRPVRDSRDDEQRV